MVWNMTGWHDFPYVGNVIIPTDWLISQHDWFMIWFNSTTMVGEIRRTHTHIYIAIIVHPITPKNSMMVDEHLTQKPENHSDKSLDKRIQCESITFINQRWSNYRIHTYIRTYVHPSIHPSIHPCTRTHTHIYIYKGFINLITIKFIE